MTTEHRPPDGDHPTIKPLLVRVAETLGWTVGQAWTVAIGLAVAVPAAIFGLGPALGDSPETALAQSPSLQPAQDDNTPPAQNTPADSAAPTQPPDTSDNQTAPTFEADPPTIGTTDAPADSSGSDSTAQPQGPTAPQAPTAPDPDPDTDDTFARIDQPGTVRAVAVADDHTAVAVDTGADQPGRVVLLDPAGEVVWDRTLETDDATYQQPAGIAVSQNTVVVTTTTPAAVVNLDLDAGEVAKRADVADLPVCLPVLRTRRCEPAPTDNAPRPQHLTATEQGDIYLADQGQACIHHLAKDHNETTDWLCDVELTPPPTAQDGGLVGLTATTDRLVLTLAPGVDGRETIQQVTINDDDEPGERSELAQAPEDAGITGVAILPDNRVVATLTSTNQLLIAQPDQQPRTVPFDAGTGPLDLDLKDDALLVAHQLDNAAGGLSKRPLFTL